MQDLYLDPIVLKVHTYLEKKLKNNYRDNLVSVSRDTLISNLVIKSGV